MRERVNEGKNVRVVWKSLWNRIEVKPLTKISGGMMTDALLSDAEMIDGLPR